MTRHTLFLIIITSAAFCESLVADTKKATHQWQTAALGGSKIGHRQITRIPFKGRVTTREALTIQFERGAPSGGLLTKNNAAGMLQRRSRNMT